MKNDMWNVENIQKYAKNKTRKILHDIILPFKDIDYNIYLNVGNQSNPLNLLSPNSGIISSTAIGTIIESFIRINLNQSYNFPLNSNKTAEDFSISDDNIIIGCNIKTERFDKYNTNKGISAINPLINFYNNANKQNKKALLLIIKIRYQILNIPDYHIHISEFDAYYLENFITYQPKCDKRNWSSAEFKKESGRLQTTSVKYDRFPTNEEVLKTLKQFKK